MAFLSELAWPRLISWGRAVLALLALVRIAFLPPYAPPAFYTLLAAYLVYAVVMAVRSGMRKASASGLLALFGDTVFFLVVASFGGERIPWLSSVLYLHLITEATVFDSPVEVGIVVAVCTVFCAVLTSNGVAALERTVVIGGVLACGFSIVRQRLDERVRELTAQLREARRSTEKALENERQRIASDFHDGPLQSFISLQMRLEILRKLLERDMASGLSDLRELQQLAQSQIRDLRAFLHSMRPVDVDGANLITSARRTAEAFQKESGIPVTFMGGNTPVGLPQETSGEVLQMLREALHNVQKHAGATRVAVVLEKTDKALEISVDDNGQGFNFAGTYSLEELELLRLGPASLKRRARSLNADLLVESRPGRGTGLKFRVPL